MLLIAHHGPAPANPLGKDTALAEPKNLRGPACKQAESIGPVRIRPEADLRQTASSHGISRSDGIGLQIGMLLRTGGTSCLPW